MSILDFYVVGNCSNALGSELRSSVERLQVASADCVGPSARLSASILCFRLDASSSGFLFHRGTDRVVAPHDCRMEFLQMEVPAMSRIFFLL
jgi:hypothetical protein